MRTQEVGRLAPRASGSGWLRSCVGHRSELTVSVMTRGGPLSFRAPTSSARLHRRDAPPPRPGDSAGQPTLAGVVERECHFHGGTYTGALCREFWPPSASTRSLSPTRPEPPARNRAAAPVITHADTQEEPDPADVHAQHQCVDGSCHATPRNKVPSPPRVTIRSGSPALAATWLSVIPAQPSRCSQTSISIHGTPCSAAHARTMCAASTAPLLASFTTRPIRLIVI